MRRRIKIYEPARKCLKTTTWSCRHSKWADDEPLSSRFEGRVWILRCWRTSCSSTRPWLNAYSKNRACFLHIYVQGYRFKYSHADAIHYRASRRWISDTSCSTCMSAYRSAPPGCKPSSAVQPIAWELAGKPIVTIGFTCDTLKAIKQMITQFERNWKKMTVPKISWISLVKLQINQLINKQN